MFVPVCAVATLAAATLSGAFGGAVVYADTPSTPIGDGTYLVGSDIAPGTYRTPGPDKSDAVPMCFWSRNKDSSGELSGIIANGAVQGPGLVTVKPGDNNVQFTGGCTWTKAGG